MPKEIIQAAVTQGLGVTEAPLLQFQSWLWSWTGGPVVNAMSWGAANATAKIVADNFKDGLSVVNKETAKAVAKQVGKKLIASETAVKEAVKDVVKETAKKLAENKEVIKETAKAASHAVKSVAGAVVEKVTGNPVASQVINVTNDKICKLVDWTLPTTPAPITSIAGSTWQPLVNMVNTVYIPFEQGRGMAEIVITKALDAVAPQYSQYAYTASVVVAGVTTTAVSAVVAKKAYNRYRQRQNAKVEGSVDAKQPGLLSRALSAVGNKFSRTEKKVEQEVKQLVVQGEELANQVAKTSEAVMDNVVAQGEQLITKGKVVANEVIKEGAQVISNVATTVANASQAIADAKDKKAETFALEPARPTLTPGFIAANNKGDGFQALAPNTALNKVEFNQFINSYAQQSTSGVPTFKKNALRNNAAQTTDQQITTMTKEVIVILNNKGMNLPGNWDYKMPSDSVQCEKLNAILKDIYKQVPAEAKAINLVAKATPAFSK